MTRAADKPITARWTPLSEACQHPDWPEQRLVDEMRDGSLPYVGYPPGLRIDWAHCGFTLKIVCRENRATWLSTMLEPMCVSGIKVYIDNDPVAASPRTKASTKEMLCEAVKRWPRMPNEEVKGDAGYAQRLQQMDPRLAEVLSKTIVNLLYGLKLV